MNAAKRIDLGPATQRIVANLIRIRKERNLTYTQISAALEEIGRPIPILGLRRIEAGERRIDVDDVEALAQVLGVVPLALIYPIGTDQEEVELLPHVRARTWDAAKWFTGEGGRPGITQTQLSAAAPLVSGGPVSASAYVLDVHRRHDQLVAAWNEAKDSGPREQAEHDLTKLRQDMAMLGIGAPPLPAGLRHIDQAESTKRKGRKQQ